MTLKLSICIPTYNRSQELDVCLESLKQSIGDKYRDQIELVISNNASTDDTERIAKKHLSTIKHGFYIQNPENVGADKNIYLVAERASGEFIWIIGDDDKVTIDAIDSVFDAINSGYEMIVLNYSVWNRDLSRVLNNSGVGINNNISFTDPNNVLETLNIEPGLISIVIIKREAFFLTPKKIYFSRINSGFAHLYAFYAGIYLNKSRVLYHCCPIVLNRANNTGQYDLVRYFTQGIEEVFSSLLAIGYSNSAVDRARRSYFRSYWLRNIVFVKVRKDYDAIRCIKFLYKYYRNDWLFWIILIPLWIIPPWIIMRLRNLIRLARIVPSKTL